MCENFLEVSLPSLLNLPLTHHPHVVFFVCDFLPPKLYSIRSSYLFVLVSYCSCNKLPELLAQNNTRLFCDSSLGQKSEISLTGLKSRGWQDLPFLKSLGENLFFAFSSFWRPLAFFGLGPLSCITPTSCFHWHISYLLSAVKSLSLCLL